MNTQNELSNSPYTSPNSIDRNTSELKRRKAYVKPKAARLSIPSYKGYKSRSPLDESLHHHVGPSSYEIHQRRVPQAPEVYPKLNPVSDPWRRRSEPPRYNPLTYQTDIPPTGKTHIKSQFPPPREPRFTRGAHNMINDGVSQPPLGAPSASGWHPRALQDPIRAPVLSQNEWVFPQPVQAAKSSMLDRQSQVHQSHVGHRPVVVPHPGSRDHVPHDRSERIVDDAVRSDLVPPSNPQPSAISDEETDNEGLWTELENMLQTMGRGLRNCEAAQDDAQIPFSSNSPCDLEDLTETESSPPSLTRSLSGASLSSECIFNGPLISQGIVPSRVNPPVYTSLDDVPQHIRHLLAVRRARAGSIKRGESTRSIHSTKLHRDVSYVYHAFRDQPISEDFEFDFDLEENDYSSNLGSYPVTRNSSIF